MEEPSPRPYAGRHSRVSEEAPPTVTSRRILRVPRITLWERGGSDRGAPSKRSVPLPSGWAFARSVLTGVTLLMLGFVTLFTLGSQLQQSRDQQVLYSQFREQLANAVAPVGPVTAEGTLVQPGAPVAILEIPDLGLSQVVVESTTSGDTMSGPGHRRDTVLPGQAGTSVVLGRQAAYGGPFGDIGSLAAGALITTTTGQGIATYKVDRVRRAGDPQPPPLGTGGARLILTSASGTPFLPDGLVRVDATLVETTLDGVETSTDAFPAAARLIGPVSLPPSERAMGTDTSQLFLLVLWAQAFLIAVLAFTWARERWGRWQTWTVGLPVLLALGWAVAGQLALLLPNLL